MAALGWSTPIVDGDVPEPRGGHTAVSAESQIVIFGGHSYSGNGQFKYYNDTYVLDTDSYTWHSVQCSGSMPPTRFGHSVELVGSRMFVFGGKGEAGALRDMHFLDLIEWTWVVVNATTASPSPRFNHASALVGRKIVIHGGWDGHHTCMNDMWVFDTESFMWLQPRTAGLAPTPRYGHTLTLLMDGRILCFGGIAIENDVPQYYNDLRQLDTETMKWSKPRTGGIVTPSGRFGHSLTPSPLDSRLIIFGGWGLGGMQDEANKKTGSGTVFLIDTAPPDTSDINAMAWVQPEVRKIAHKYGHTTTVIGTKAFVFGGWNGKQAINELVELKFA